VRAIRVLVVDDEAGFLRVLHGELGELGFDVVSFPSAEEAMAHLRNESRDVVVADMRMAGPGGMDLLKASVQENWGVQVIILTGGGTIESAVEAMKLGAYDYVLKPVDLEKLAALIGKAAERATLQRENRRLQGALRRAEPAPAIVGGGPAMKRALDLARRAAASESTVLVVGETGAGKDLFARLIHRESARSRQPLITVNCATLPESLIESELFGHRKGAFTGAFEHREGVFELADGGTLFLDEIAEIPASLQSKLLRALQFGEVKRLGDTVSRTTDARVIGATSRDLKAEMAAGRFREDLYYRLNVVELRIPPLRERLEDIPELVAAILSRARRAEGPRRLSPRSLDLLMKYDWPGNVRQLENLLERCQVLSDDVEIDLARTPFAAEIEESASPVGRADAATLEEIERRHIRSTLERHKGNRAAAAGELGISVRALYYKIKSLDVKS